ncbi:MAG: hypothetical protein WAM98_18530, partial [Terriglobales bacterium]
MTPGIEIRILVLVILLVGPSLIRIARGEKFDPFWPPLVFAFSVFLAYLSPLPDFLDGSDAISKVWGADFAHFNESLESALTLVSVGVVGFYTGYFQHSRSLRGGHQFGLSTGPSLIDAAQLKRLGLIYGICGVGLLGAGIMMIGGWGML